MRETYLFSEIELPRTKYIYTHVSIPGRILHVYRPHTGLWSDVQIDGTEVYAKQLILVPENY